MVGPSPVAALAVTQAALAVAVLATYRLGVRLASAPAGLAAGLLLAGYTEIVLESRVFMLDLPLTALVAATALALVRAEGFTRPGWCAVAGVLGGLGLLTKWTYPVFVVPIGVAVWLAPPRDARRGPRARHLAMAAAIAAVLAAPWYLRHPGLPVSLLRTAYAMGAAEGDPAIGAIGAWTWYARALPWQLGPPFALLVAGLAWAIARRPPGLALLGAWLVVPLLLFAALRNKDFRYTLPCLPAAALLSTAWIARLRPRAAALAVAALAVVLTAHVAFLAWGVPAPAWARGRMTRDLLLPSFPPIAERWPVVDILDRVARDGAAAGRRVTVAVAPDFIFFSPFTFAYYATRDARPVRVTRARDGAPRFVDYVVTKSGDQGPEHTTGGARALMARLERGDPALASLLREVADLPLPDGSRARVYRVDPAPVAGVSASALLERLRAAPRRALDWVVRDARGLTIEVDPYSDAETLAGRLRRLGVRAETARVGDFRRKPVGLRVHAAALALEDVRLDPAALATRGAIEILGARRLVIHEAVVTAPDLAQALAELAPWLERPAVAVAGGRLEVEAGLGGGPRAAIALRPVVEAGGGGRLEVWAEAVRLGPVPLPAAVVNAALGLLNPVVRLGDRPLAVAPPRLVLEAGRLRIETPRAAPR